MSANLYETLDVPKSASKADIRKAYRRKAKAAHPDTGGSREAFALITLAAETLSDDDRRAHYDRTGEIDDSPKDTTFTEALQAVMQLVENAMAQTGAMGFDHVDIVARAIDAAKSRKREIEAQAKATEQEAAKWDKVALKFKAKRGKENRLAAMMRSKAASFRASAETVRKPLPIIDLAIEILSDHTFDFTAPTQSAYTAYDMSQLGRSSFFGSVIS